MMRVVSIEPGGRGYDLSDGVTGLRYSNVNPGGDESCSFTLKRSWGANSPEVAKLNTIRVESGLDVVWQGRVEEIDRGEDGSESMAVTAYGKGQALRDNRIRQIFVDQSVDGWTEASTQRKLNIDTGALWAYVPPAGATPDNSTGAPSLQLRIQGPAWAAGNAPLCEAMYDAQGIPLGSLYYAWKKNSNLPAGPDAWQWAAYLSTDDVQTTTDATADLQAAGPGSGTLTATNSNRTYAMVQLLFTGAGGTANAAYSVYWTSLAVYGLHGLTPKGTSPGGFTADQVVNYLVAQLPSLTARRVDPCSFVIGQLVFTEPTPHEDVLAEVSRYENCDWGTWGPDSPLTFSTNGYLDYTAKDLATQHWIAERADFDGLDLHTETATLYNRVIVRYSDVAGASQTLTRSRAVAELDSAGVTRTADLDGGTLTTAGAQTLGDIFLSLQGGFAPARGSGTITNPIMHYRRGRLGPEYLRADGSNLRIRDVLPTTTLFALDSTPDRRATFPLKRVEVDCSGAAPTATVELDQTNDLLSMLQARLGLAAQLTTS